MRILSVGNRYPPWSLGGYETIWQNANRWLREAGHDVRVLTTRADPTDRPADGAVPPVHRDLAWYWRAHGFPRRGPRAVLSLERHNLRTLRRHLDDFAPEAVAWWSLGGMSLSLVEQVRRAGAPAVGVVADDWMVYGPEVDRWTNAWRGRPRAAAAAERLTGIPARVELDGAAQWLFISQHLLERARRGGHELRGAAVIHPGIDPARFAPAAPRDWRWQLLYCGRLDPRKGVDTAVRALRDLPREATLTLDGDGESGYRAELLALARELGVAERMQLRCSERGALPAAYAAADAVLFPVRWEEPWGLVPLEAMAMGRPVLASRAGGGPAEYLREAENCLTFAVDDAQGRAAGVRRLAAEPALRTTLVSGGHVTAAAWTEAAFHAGLERELQALIPGTTARLGSGTGARA